ncbi:MAG: hypothetical protein WEB60_00995 [Terrimicrobiaceae bacterium]
MNALDPTVDPRALGRAQGILAALPEGGLFHEKSWRVSPDPFPITPEFHKRLEKLGHQLTVFVKACAQLYRTSVDGRQPPWIAGLLDRGKPRELIEIQRNKLFANDIPRVLRPDLILTEKGFTIAELDSVPGGIGLTAWLGKSYAPHHPGVIGGPTGMLEGFESVMSSGDIVVSEEASTYRPEMEWLAQALEGLRGTPGRWRVVDASQRDDWAPQVYRFFELFDLANVPCAPDLIQRASAGHLSLTPPLKPALEEKLWFALFWLKPLEAFWVRALGEGTYKALHEVIPQTWLLDPQPLPPHAVIPGLEIHSWDEALKFSQKQRDLILKISGFSETAWGSRGVFLGSDLPSQEWAAELKRALSLWPTAPHILQRFHHSRLFHHPVYQPLTEKIENQRFRVRLCPYYFVTPEKTQLGGALATLCPDDKKLLHGMPDAVLVPTSVEAGDSSEAA